MPKIVGMCFEASGTTGPMQLHQSGAGSFVLEYDGATIAMTGDDTAALRELLEFVRKRQTMVTNLLKEG